MGEVKRIMICLPDTLLAEVDGIVRKEKRNRSEFIREAMRRYIEERRKAEMRVRMKEGYLKMASLNRELAEGALAVDAHVLDDYEAYLVGGEEPGG
ncbi:MAG TPA: ribbon-helix-helix protein, CopG family [Firmicutes bacterium]|nr:ribbon-helix-helix protein, CopG family [Bacillota bacterium]